jgi:ethanolamine utilization protein EutN
MQLGRVTGTIVATVKVPGLTGIKLLIVQPLDRELKPVGGQVVAADAVHMAGPGELVYVVAAREAAQAMPDPFVPVDHAIVGIVDAVRSLAGDEPTASTTPPAEPAVAPAPSSAPASPAPDSSPAPRRRARRASR